MNAFAPLLGVMVLSVVLVANFFKAAWTLGILRAFGRRQVPWRTLAAGALAACLPFAGAILALEMIPSDNGIDLSLSAAQLSMQLAASGLAMHLINDRLILWGARAQPRA